MSEVSLLTAARAAVTTALPGARDWSDNPSDPRPNRLGAYVISVTRDKATAAAMGSDQEEVELTIQVEVFDKFDAAEQGRADMKAKANLISEQMLPAINALPFVDRAHFQTLEIELAQGEKRFAYGDLSFSVEATF